MHLSAPRLGTPLLVGAATAASTTLGFVERHKALFKMRDAERELRVQFHERDERNMTHVRFQQVHHGVPVVGAEMYAHYDAEGRLVEMDATYKSGIDVDVQPAFSSDVGRTFAVCAAGPGAVADAGRLVVFASERAPTLAYEYTVREPASRSIWITTVDAKTGELLHRYDNLQTVEATGKGVLGDTKKLSVSPLGQGYAMRDLSRGVTIDTYTADGKEIGPDEGALPVVSSSLTSWDTGVGAGAAVDAHAYAGAVYDYYKKVHGRNSIDGMGGAMLSTVHFGQAFDNAGWDGRGMSYGDGGITFKPLSVALDVVGHEFTHGVTQHSSNLKYETQSGALNEAVSDIFAVFIEHSLQPDDTKNWTLGEVALKAGGVLRDCKTPGVGHQPAHMNEYVNTRQDNGGVHINSGIPNNAAYLMTMGGTNPVSNVIVKFGLGWEKSEKLWYRANTKYFMETTNFAQAAAAMMSAATDLGFTENEKNIVDCAWKATGVVQGACASVTDPNSPAPQTAQAPSGASSSSGAPSATPEKSATNDSAEATATPSESVASKGTSRRVAAPATESGCSLGRAPADGSGIWGLGTLGLLGLVMRRRRRSPLSRA
jgi:thermolysin